MSEWRDSALPRCFGHPAKKLTKGAHTAWIWRGSAHTTRQEWIWRIDEGPIHIIRGNMGSAKSAAQRALRKASGPLGGAGGGQ